MRWIIGFTIALTLGLTAPADAVIMKYKDKTGKVWYVNRIDAIPPEYRNQVSSQLKNAAQRAEQKQSGRKKAPASRVKNSLRKSRAPVKRVRRRKSEATRLTNPPKIRSSQKGSSYR